MYKKVFKSNKFAIEIQKALSKYERDIWIELNNELPQLAQDTRDKVADKSPVGNTGDYQEGWTVERVPVGRLEIASVIWNKDEYRLAHLLEFGHALKEGGRQVGETRAFEHIQPANDWAVQQVDDVIKQVVEKANEEATK